MSLQWGLFFQHSPNVLVGWTDYPKKLWNYWDILGNTFKWYFVNVPTCINQPFFLQKTKIFKHFKRICISVWVVIWAITNLESRHLASVVGDLNSIKSTLIQILLWLWKKGILAILGFFIKLNLIVF